MHKLLWAFLDRELQDKYPESYEMGYRVSEELVTTEFVAPVPSQTNTWDCGLFSCRFVSEFVLSCVSNGPLAERLEDLAVAPASEREALTTEVQRLWRVSQPSVTTLRKNLLNLLKGASSARPSEFQRTLRQLILQEVPLRIPVPGSREQEETPDEVHRQLQSDDFWDVSSLLQNRPRRQA